MNKPATIWTFRLRCAGHLSRATWSCPMTRTRCIYLRCFLGIGSEQRCSVSFLTKKTLGMLQMRFGSEKCGG